MEKGEVYSKSELEKLGLEDNQLTFGYPKDGLKIYTDRQTKKVFLFEEVGLGKMRLYLK